MHRRTRVVVRRGRVTVPGCALADPTAATRDGLPGITLACLGKGPAVDVAGIAGPAVINLWASWCYPCRQEMPLLQHESEALGGKVRIVGVDTNDQAAHAIAFVENTVRAGYEELSDPAGKLALALHAPGLPFTVAIDRGGGIVWYTAGQLTDGEIGQAVHTAQAGG